MRFLFYEGQKIKRKTNSLRTLSQNLQCKRKKTDIKNGLKPKGKTQVGPTKQRIGFDQ